MCLGPGCLEAGVSDVERSKWSLEMAARNVPGVLVAR